MSSTVRTALENGSPTGVTLCVGGTFHSRLRGSAPGSAARVEGATEGWGQERRPGRNAPGSLWASAPRQGLGEQADPGAERALQVGVWGGS